jgi:hypothetical protein
MGHDGSPTGRLSHPRLATLVSHSTSSTPGRPTPASTSTGGWHGPSAAGKPELLAWLASGGLTNARTEAVNLLVKKIKRIGHGFRNFCNYRLRLLLHCGINWHTAPAARIRGLSQRFIA